VLRCCGAAVLQCGSAAVLQCCGAAVLRCCVLRWGGSLSTAVRPDFPFDRQAFVTAPGDAPAESSETGTTAPPLSCTAALQHAALRHAALRHRSTRHGRTRHRSTAAPQHCRTAAPHHCFS